MATCQSYSPNYFALNDILMTEERVSCRIEVEAPRLGFLDSSSTSDNLTVGAKVEFPLWMAGPLKKLQPPVLNIELPKIYKEGYREILEADADAVVLSKWNPYFYELGMYVQRYNDKESKQIADCLLQTFQSRFRLVMDWALNPISDSTLGLQLPRLERDLFANGQKAKMRLLEWLKMGTSSIPPSDVTANLKKRKRADYELY
nr:DNA replication complex GINS protein PSF3 [Nomia melanderi]